MAYTTVHPVIPPAEPEPAHPRPEGERTIAVLESARAIVARGWLQDRWYRIPPRSWWQTLFGPVPGPDQVQAACLVAAVAVAGHDGGRSTHLDRDSGPALDRVWQALQETAGRPATVEGAVAPVVRRARMRELVRWNDRPGRTRGDVLGLLDRAISRSIMAEVSGPRHTPGG